MAIRTNGRRAQKEQQKHEKEMQLQQAGQRMQQQELQDLLHNPQVMEMLLEADINGPRMIDEVAGDHMHRDQVLAIFDEEDLWRKGWKNKIWTTKVLASYPFDESGSPDPLVNETKERIHGHPKQPPTTDEERQIEALFEHKTDREKRAKDGTFLDLLLSQVVESREQSSSQDSGGALSGLLGGGD